MINKQDDFSPFTCSVIVFNIILIAECPLGEVFHECRSCPRTCAEQIDQSLCTTVCERGCGCPNGTLLDEEANRCVSVDECPSKHVYIETIIIIIIQ